MNVTSVPVCRYGLEQNFPSDRHDGVDTHRTAIVSVIGRQPLAEFTQRLVALDHGPGRFFSMCNPCVGARWVSGVTEIPRFAMGLIFVADESAAALDVVEMEAERYWDAAITPLVVGPGRIRYRAEISARLNACGLRWHFVRMRSGGASQAPAPQGFATTAIAYIEALLVAATYPSVFVIDPSDVIDVFDGAPLVGIVRFEAPTCERLVECIRVDARALRQSPGGLVALLTPSVGSLKRMQEDTTAVCAEIEQDQGARPAWLLSLVADATRDRYTLYVATKD